MTTSYHKPKQKASISSNPSSLNPKSSPGFTIVELLIFIVVIAILAAITIVAFNGIQNRASSATLQSDLRNAATELALEHADSGSYPNHASDGGPLKKSDGTTYQYTSDGTSFCLTATSSREGVDQYTVSNGSSVKKRSLRWA